MARRLGAGAVVATLAAGAGVLLGLAFAPPRLALTSPLWDGGNAAGWAGATAILVLVAAPTGGRGVVVPARLHRRAGYACLGLVAAHGLLVIGADPLVLADLSPAGPAYQIAALVGLAAAAALPLVTARPRRRTWLARLPSSGAAHRVLGLILLAAAAAHVAGSGAALLGPAKPAIWAGLCAAAAVAALRRGRWS